MILSGLKYIAGRLTHSIAVVATVVALTMVSCADDAPYATTGEDQAGVVAFRVLTFRTAATPASRAEGPFWGNDYDKDPGDNDFDIRLLKDQLYVTITDADCSQEYAVTNLVCTEVKEEGIFVRYEYQGRIDKDDVEKVKVLTNGKLHIIANAGYYPKLSNETMFTLFGQPSDNFKAIPMWGVTTCNFSNVELGKTFDVENEVSLLRSMAKVVIDIDPSADNYISELKTVTMLAANTKGYLLPDGWEGIGDTKTLDRHALRVPGAAEQQTIPLTFNFTNNRVVFYLPEMKNSADNEIALNLTFKTKYDENTPKDKTEFVFTEQWSAINTDIDADWDGKNLNWDSQTEIKTKACPRFATAMDGKIYTVDMRTMSIAEFTPDGKLEPRYYLPKLTDGDYYGTAITHDDAGNFLIGHYFTNEKSSYVWTIFSPDPDTTLMTGKAKHITLPLPPGYIAGRIDCAGRVSGDLTLDAVVHIAPANYNSNTVSNKQVLTVRFTGDGDINNVTATCTKTDVSEAGNSAALCYPVGTNSFAFYAKSTNPNEKNKVCFYNVGATSTKANATIELPNTANTEGFATFELGGKRYYVVNYLAASASGNTRPMDIAVFDKDGNLCANWSSVAYKSSLGYSSIIVDKVGDNYVDIFVYNSTTKDGHNPGAIAGAKLRLSLLHSDISGETSCERTGTLYFRPYDAKGDPDKDKSPYHIRRNYLYKYDVNMLWHDDLKVVVDVLPYKSVELEPEFGFDTPLPTIPPETEYPGWVEIEP